MFFGLKKLPENKDNRLKYAPLNFLKSHKIMFKAIEKYRTPAQVVLGLIGISFIGFGIAGFQGGADNQYIVRVGDQRITRYQLDEAIRNTEQSGGVANRQAVFETLLNQAYLLEGAKKLGIVVSDEQIKQMIVDNPQFHDASKKFDPNLFKQALEQAHISEARFMQMERERLLTVGLLQALNANVVSDYQAAQALNATFAARVMRSAPVAPQNFIGKVNSSDTELQKFYDANKKNYVLPQAVKFEYIKLSAQNLLDKQTVSDDELKQAFEAQKGNVPSKRRIAHILFNAPASADADTKAKAKAQAEKVAAELQQNPSQFAALAKQHSQDSGSASKGGDLGEFSQNGGLGSKALEDAAFALEKGAVSGVVETDFGYHIVQVTDIVSGDSFEAQKASLKKQIQERKAQQALGQLSNELGQLTFDNPNDLKSAAEKKGLTTQSDGEWLTRANAAERKIPNAVVEALFSDEVFAKKHNSDAISVNGETWFVRATETRNETTQPLSEVRERVKDDWVNSESTRLAREAAKKDLADLQAGKSVDLAWSPTQELVPAAAKQALPPEVYAELMKAVPKNGKPAYAFVEWLGVPQIIEVQSIKSISHDEKSLKDVKQTLAQISSNDLILAFINSLRSEVKTKEGIERVSDSESESAK
ncbi:peptidyl-prolyl cis-trans isomerase D [Alysiella filiformis DSM 16848]|uniref:Periplasmic chaperone PpiD n=2 Tax=Alysiella TaxID=194195 RepID=A0A286EB05_9NEIS|nr:peptidyl-prolyl cis-trans isomerase D [Alysiella filiformis DSM 16848]